MTDSIAPGHPGRYVKEQVIPEGVSVKKASEMMDIGRPALSNFLNGRANLSQNMAARLEKAFGVNKDNLLNRQQEYDAYLSKEGEKRMAVKSYTPSFLKITSTQVDAWADAIEARSLLPVLLRRLVISTGSEISASDFPGYDNSQTPSWDGYVESSLATPWIPLGASGWEFGTNNKPATKANGDYKARTESIPSEDRKNITFVFVTPRNWPKKNEWQKKMTAKGEWKAVVALDAGDIEQWLETSISAQVWFAERLGIPTSGCESLPHYWDFWSTTSEPPISQRIFNGAITDFQKKVEDWLASIEGKPLLLSAASIEEARAFLCALAQRSDAAKGLQDNALFVTSKESLKRLSEVSSAFIPVVYTDEAQDELVVSFKNRHYIVITEQHVKGADPDINLELPNFESIKAALQEMEFDEAEIDVLVNHSGSSPTILRRQLAKLPAHKKPAWAMESHRLRKMIPLVLAGSWSVNKEADQQILHVLADKDYELVEQSIAELSSIDDSPIWSEGSYRGAVSSLDSFLAVADQLTEKDLSDFLFCCELVLSEDDPSLDLASDDRWAAGIYNKIREHSDVIRDSLCHNMIMLEVHGNAMFGDRIGIDVPSRINVLVKNLIENKEPRAWQAQQNRLPYYAEAAPNVFLDIVEEELHKERPAFENLFQSVRSGMFSRCDRTGMLWALELLAWSPEYLSRVVIVLGKLCRYDLDDNWAHKPLESLKDILLYWRPHTAATVEQRCDVLGILCERFQEVGWEVCLMPFDTHGGFTSGTYKPRWRGYATGTGNAMTHGEMRIFAKKCIEILMVWPRHTASTLSDLVSCLASFDEDSQVNVTLSIKEWIDTSPSDEERIHLREHIRTRTMTTRALRRNKRSNFEYADGKELYDLLEPEDVLTKHAWLFANTWVEYTSEELADDNLDHEVRETKLLEQRKTAIQDVIEKKGLKGVLELLKTSSCGFPVGNILCNRLRDVDSRVQFISDCLILEGTKNRDEENCIAGIIESVENDERIGLINSAIDKLSVMPNSDDLVSKFLLCAPFVHSVWDLVSRQNDIVQGYYWSRVRPWGNNLSEDDYQFAIEKLIKADRPLVALSMVRFNLDKVDTNQLVSLMKAVAAFQYDPEVGYVPDQHHIEEILEELNNRQDVDRSEMVELEFIYVDVLYSFSKYGVPNLSKRLAQSPHEFIQLVAMSFKRSDHEDDFAKWGMPDDNDERKGAASSAHHALKAINVIPGTDANGKISESDLKGWVYTVRQIAKEHNRIAIADQMIGKLFSTSTGEDDDGVWPRKEIRSVIEEMESTDISIGIELGVYNDQGAQFRDVNSLQERDKAKKYREMASKVINKMPFVAKMLLSMAKRYDRDAEWWTEDYKVNKRLGRY